MHPFSLSKEQIEQVSGGTEVSNVLREGGGECSILNYETGLQPTQKLNEDGGELTTMAIGEEGGLPAEEI
ncbi:hypothetical protein [Pseudoduganella sp.]|uniref:hypothetical protein n=1 Tax=Pseudoduganella sp. TaxID=1880898 RepID=UPI0035AE8EE6